MNGGKDVKFGDDKRPVSIVPSNEQELFNYRNGERLTDEFGNPLITEVDTFYLPDATAKRSTSVVLPTKESSFGRKTVQNVGTATVIYADLDLHVSPNVLRRSGSPNPVSIGETVLLADGVSTVTLEQFTNFEVRVRSSLNRAKNELYGNIPATVKVGDAITGPFITPGSLVSEIAYGRTRLYMSENYSAEENYTSEVSFIKIADEQGRPLVAVSKHNPTLKVAEAFRESSEVSSTLLGVNRAEVQLSLFSNVSSYGIDPDEFETFGWTDGISFRSWDERYSSFYGEDRYNTKESEETTESAIRIGSFSVPYAYPYGPKFQKLGLYKQSTFDAYIRFIEFGNKLHEHYKSNGSYSNEWKNKFLPINVTTVTGGDVIYSAGVRESFAQIDIWTETWRDIKDNLLKDPISGSVLDFGAISQLSTEFQNIDGSSKYAADNTRPGYSETRQKYVSMQSRRVFRYQPGRISGFTFGLRSSTEAITGATMEWGIGNPTDQYVFRIFQGNLSIIRRSTIPLEGDSLTRSGLSLLDQKRIEGNDPFDVDPLTGNRMTYWTIDIPKDNFNGDSLDGNGASGYNVNPEKVTMWKIEFGWYGAIGARFYAYIPAGNGEARWVVIHTIVIENSLGQPCLRDSYFRFIYNVNITNSADLRQPHFVYKYGASYYIDGGDEGTLQVFSANSGVKQIFASPADRETLIGIKPKEFILNSTGEKIINKKLIIPDKISVSTDSLAEVKVETCRACPGFGHVLTPGIAKTDFNRSVNIAFSDPSTIVTTGSDFFFKSDEGAKLIAPTIWNAYIDEVSGETPIGSGNFTEATLKGYEGISGVTFGPRSIADGTLVLDSVIGAATTIGLSDYPHPVRLSQRNFYVSSDLPIYGNEIDIQFINPLNDDIYNHFADFSIGITNIKPVTAAVGDALDGFEVETGVTTSVLPDSKILFAEYTHRYASINEEGVETGEVDGRVQPPRKLSIDFRIPRVSDPAGGMCSRVRFKVLNSQPIENVTLVSGNEPGGGSGSGHYLVKSGDLPLISYDGGQVTIEDVNGNPLILTAVRFVGEVKTYNATVSGQQQKYSYIEINQSFVPPTSTFIILIRPIKMITNDDQEKIKLYNYIPFPLYFVAKMSDASAINNLSIKETTGDYQKTSSPKLFVSNVTNNTSDIFWSGSGEVTLADNKTSNTGASPTNFKGGSDRLSGSEIDNQNVQPIRSGVLRDTFYVGKQGEQSTTDVDMTKIFGTDKRVIAPDRDNIEATFFTAKKIDPGTTGEVQMSLNYKEQ